MSIVKPLLAATALVSGMIVATAASAQVAYRDASGFATATSRGAFTSQSFEAAPVVSGQSLDFGNVTLTCQGSTYCPGFFGRGTLLHSDGDYSIQFASPDAITFSFASAITAFGIDVIDLGTIGATNFYYDIGSGPVALMQNYDRGGVAFAGITSSTGFKSVTFTSSQRDDGVYFDNLRFSADAGAQAAAVPEPATWALMILGFGAAGAGLRRRQRASVRLA